MGKTSLIAALMGFIACAIPLPGHGPSQWESPLWGNGESTEAVREALEAAWPGGIRLDGVEETDGGGWMLLTFPEGARPGIEEHLLEDLDLLLQQLEEGRPGDRPAGRLARLGETGEYRPLREFMAFPEIPSKPLPPHGPVPPEEMAPLSIPHIPAQGQAQPSGALSGASVFLSPGHGWHYSTNLNRWATQRGNTHQYIEDHGTGEAVLQFLHQYLWNAGADVYTMRERCMNRNMVIVQHGGAGYSQTGAWTLETLTGAYNGNQRRASTVTGSPTATATFTPNIPEAGHYGVYVWYRRAGAGNTTEDARITVNHTGDSTLWVQNQNHDGFTWKYIGTYFFEAGVNPQTGSVAITNESAVAGRQVVAGAVRFGGGMGDVPDPSGGTVSGKPRWEESGRYYAGFMGVPNWQNNGTVNAMPRMAAWEHEAHQAGRSVYVSWHTNASGGTGTETFAFSSHGWNGAFNGVAGGDRLRDYLQDTAVRDFRAAWNPNWVGRTNRTANFGELNPNNNPHMPAALIEIAFHDHVSDVRYLLDPEFRRDAARAVYKGILRYFQNEVSGFNNGTFLPEPPRSFRAISSAPGQVTLQWAPPVFSTGPTGLHGHQATGFRVYKSYNGKGFDNGRDVTGTLFTFEDLEPGRVVYFRVSATNAGGESFPTETLAVRPGGGASPDRVLLVNGFNRLDRFLNVVENDPHSSNPLQRGYLWRMNTFDYTVEHAAAIAAFPADFPIDSTSMEVVRQGVVSLGGYAAVIWIGGRQAQVNDIGNRDFSALPNPLPSRLANYLQGGGKLFLSGSETASDLQRAGLSSFLQSILRSSFLEQNPNANQARGAASSIMADVDPHSFGHGPSSVYEVARADVIEPVQGSSPLMFFSGTGTGMIDDFESASGWLNPASAGQTNAAGTTFQIVGSPVHSGAGAGRLTYEWGSGNLIRLYKSALPELPVDSDMSIWVFGDNSGNDIQLAIRDADGEIWRSPLVTLNWTGWREVIWEDIRHNSTFWALPGDGVVTGPMVRFDSIFLHRRPSSPNAGAVFFDELTAAPTGGDPLDPVAGVQYGGNYQLVYLSYPFESISSAAAREQIMARSLEFFGLGLSPFEKWLARMFTPEQLEDPAISGKFADPAGDGIPNLVKYALGLDPFRSSRDELPLLGLREGHLEFVHTLGKGTDDIRAKLDISEDLITWREAGEEWVETARVDEGERVRITLRDQVPHPSDGRRFVRLVVERL